MDTTNSEMERELGKLTRKIEIYEEALQEYAARGHQLAVKALAKAKEVG